MSTQRTQLREPAAPHWELDRWLLRRLRRYLEGAPLRFVLGDADLALGEEPVATVVIRDRSSLVRVLWDPDLGLGEGFRSGRIEVQGDLVRALEAGCRALDGLNHGRRWAHGHSPRVARRNARSHYDLGNEFYRLWLDEQLVYTCAYFPSPEATLEEAQVAKMERVCRKLALRPGERVIEAGCGWGALALYMARERGVHVTAYNVSAEQVSFARERASREGLSDRVTFVEDDYRAVAGKFDVFVSVGMLEHVGPGDYPTLGTVIARCLAPGHGRGLLHFIGRDRPRPLSSWIRRRIFPGAYPPTLAEATSGVLEPAGCSVLDVENLRLHYAATLSHWRRRFEGVQEDVARTYGPEFARGWRFYLAGSEAAFRAGSMQLFQVTFARTGDNAVPWARPGH